VTTCSSPSALVRSGVISSIANMNSQRRWISSPDGWTNRICRQGGQTTCIDVISKLRSIDCVSAENSAPGFGGIRALMCSDFVATSVKRLVYLPVGAIQHNAGR
jgi:hypothetical protein